MTKNFLPEELEVVKAYFPKAIVEYTKNGNIRIMNPDNCDCGSYWGHNCRKWYVIGFTNGNFWIRRVKYDLYWKETNSTYPLKYNRKTGNYFFGTFEDAFSYFVKQVTSNRIDF